MRRRVPAGPESEAERRIWEAVVALRPAELEGLVPQHKVLRYRLDMAIPRLGIGFEIDGYEYHSDKATFVADRQRHRHLESEGWRIIRFAGREAVYDPKQCVRQMALLVARIGEERRQYLAQKVELERAESQLKHAEQTLELERTKSSLELMEACAVFDIDLAKLQDISECEHEFDDLGFDQRGAEHYSSCFYCGVDREFLERISWPLGTIICIHCSPFDTHVACLECGRGFE